MRRFACIFVLILICASISSISSADTLYLKNGNKFEGIITKETDDTVELNIGGGTLTFHKRQIKKIERSTPEEIEDIKDNLNAQNAELKSKEAEFTREREERFKKYEEWSRESAAKKNMNSGEAGEVQLVKVENSQDLMVEVVINGTARATLILDTGSSYIILTRRIGDILGVDFSDNKNNVQMIRLTGKERLTKAVKLESFRINNVEEKNLIALVLFEDVHVLGLKDGLLGLSFLNRFNSIIDLKKMKLSLRKK